MPKAPPEELDEVTRLRAALYRIGTAKWFRRETPMERLEDLQDMALQALEEHDKRMKERQS